MTNLQQRCLTAAVMVPYALCLIWAGGLGYRLLVAVIGGLSLHEWFALLQQRGGDKLRGNIAWHVWLVGLCAALLDKHLIAIGIFFVGGIIALSWEWKKSRALAIWSGLGVFYIGTTIISLLSLRVLPDHPLALTFFVFLSVWMTDICAYFVGMSLGGPKLAPRISPSKTWSGLAGGIAGATVTGFGLAVFTKLPDPALYACGGALLAIVAQAGDLLESALKRFCNAKDSGRVIPGHGGVLDRVDGLLAAALGFVCVHHALPFICRF